MIPRRIDQYTGDDSILITNKPATRKFLRLLDRRYGFIPRGEIDPAGVSSLIEKYGRIFVVFLDRNDSEFHRDEAERNDEFIGTLTPTPQLVFEKHLSSTEHLRIWRVGEDTRS